MSCRAPLCRVRSAPAPLSDSKPSSPAQPRSTCTASSGSGAPSPLFSPHNSRMSFARCTLGYRAKFRSAGSSSRSLARRGRAVHAYVHWAEGADDDLSLLAAEAREPTHSAVGASAARVGHHQTKNGQRPRRRGKLPSLPRPLQQLPKTPLSERGKCPVNLSGLRIPSRVAVQAEFSGQMSSAIAASGTSPLIIKRRIRCSTVGKNGSRAS